MARVSNRLSRTTGRLTLGVVATAAITALLMPSAIASPESDAADAINQAWQAAGGADSVVGNQDGEVYQVGEGFGQKFSGGKIFFTPATGAHLITGAILDKYESLGGPGDSDLGFPNIDEVPGLISPSSRVSTFSASDKPAIFWTADTGAWAVRGAINAAWDKLGGSAGTLGVPVEDESYEGDVVRQKFTGGEVAWNRVANTFTSEPPALAEQLAGLDVPLDPTTLINLAWRTSGGLGGPLGARQGTQSTVGDNGAAQGYAGGKIFYSPQTGAHAVTGAILSKYESLGGPTGDLGYPVGTEVDGGVPNSRVSTFSAADKPVIFWTPDSGAIVVRGAINAAWERLGGPTGSLGVPSGEQTVNGDTVTQAFSGGEISWNQATREFSSNPADLAASLSGLELPDAMANAPATTGSGTAAKSGWHWWWLAILLPLILLLGLLTMLARRKAAGRQGAAGSDRAGGRETDDDFWPGSRSRRDGYDDDRYPDDRYDEDGWSRSESADGYDDADFDSDEDSIDTAPTRIPTADDLADAGEFSSAATDADDDDWFHAPDSGTGRHSSGIEGLPAAWRRELDELTGPRHRHAAGDLTSEVSAEAVVTDVEIEAAPESEAESGFASGSWAVPDPALESEAESVSQAEVVSDTSGQEDDDSWRPAIHLPLADPYQAPEGYVIKGNTHSGLYYTPDSALYDNTIPEVWFASEELAKSNGFVKAPE